MSKLDSFLKNLNNISEKELRKILMEFRIGDFNKPNFKTEFVETEAIVKLGKLIASLIKLDKKMKLAVTGVKGNGKTTALEYIYEKLNSYGYTGCLNTECNGDYVFITNVRTLKQLNKVNLNNYKIAIAELSPFLTLHKLEQLKKQQWKIAIFPSPSCEEIKQMLSGITAVIDKITCEKSITLSIFKSIKNIKLNMNLTELPETKKMLLLLLSDSNYTLSDISMQMGTALATVRKHLEILEKQKLVAKKRKGKIAEYFLPNLELAVRISEWGIQRLKERGIFEI